jgi:hypothetical protein
MLKWFPVAWPDRTLRLRVAGEYQTLAACRYMMADIAMRNFLFEPAPEGADLAIIEGRRRAALEIFQMARVNPADIADVGVRVQQR